MFSYESPLVSLSGAEPDSVSDSSDGSDGSDGSDDGNSSDDSDREGGGT